MLWPDVITAAVGITFKVRATKQYLKSALMNTEGSVCTIDIHLIFSARAAALAMSALIPYAVRHTCVAQETTAYKNLLDANLIPIIFSRLAKLNYSRVQNSKFCILFEKF